jgi:hypothetical protein
VAESAGAGDCCNDGVMATDDGPRTIKLRYAGTCATCGVALAAGTKAVWKKSAGGASCLSCASPTDGPGASDVRGIGEIDGGRPTAIKVPPAEGLPISVAGASSQAEFDRRHQRREQALDARWGRLAGVAKLLSDDPQSTKAWARGAEGERRLAAHLTRLLGDRAVFLHDRKVGRANIDHLIVASSGVWVVDAKNYIGRVEYRNVAGWLRSADNRIFVGGRDRTKVATGLGWQVTAVRDALGDCDAPIHPAVCFTSSEWGLFAKPFRHDGVLVTWASKLAETVAEAGDLGPEEIERFAARLGERLRPAG